MPRLPSGLLTLLLCSGTLAAADAPPLPPPGLYLPSAVGTWLSGTDVPAGGVRIDSVTPGDPAERAGVTPGAVIARLGDRQPRSWSELLMCRDLVARGVEPPVMLAGAETAQGVLVGLALTDGRLGVDGITPWPEANDEAPVGPVGDDERRRILATMPPRVRLEARAAAADPAVHATAADGWRRCLDDTWVAAVRGEAPPAAVAQPRPFLTRVLALWRAAATDRPGLLAPAATWDDGAFALLYFPYPLPSTGLGALTLGAPATRDLLTRMAQGTADRGALRRQAQAMLVGDKPADLYLGQVQAALLDPQNHGGWPFRSSQIWEAQQRAAVVAELAKRQGEAGADSQLLALGRIGPAVMDHDWTALAEAITTLHRGSPWLARRGLDIAMSAARMHRVTDDLQHGLFPRLAGALDRCSERIIALVAADRVSGDAFAASEGIGTHLDQPLRLLPAWCADGDAWNAQERIRQRLAASLVLAVAATACDPASLDPAGTWSLSRQLLAVAGDGVPNGGGRALAYAAIRSRHIPLAVAWQRAVIRRMGERADDEVRGRLKLFQAGTPYTTDGPAPGAPQTTRLPDGGASTGGSINNLAAGRWTRTAADGALLEETWFRAGDPAGRHQAFTATGALRWTGFVWDGARLGWWRVARPAGGVAEGWYDGVDDGRGGRRCGWWRVLDVQGALLAEGFCAGGQPSGTWRRADGAVVADPAALLPSDPPLPHAGSDPAVSF